MSKKSSYQQNSYGFPSPLASLFPRPIVAQRAPTTHDTGAVEGQIWVDQVGSIAYTLIKNAGGTATWGTAATSSPTFATVTATTVLATTATVTTFQTATAATRCTFSGNTIAAIGTDAAIGLTITPKGTGALTVTTGNIIASNGNLQSTTAGKGLVLAEGANARMGTATLIGGTIAVANTSVTANTRVYICRTSAGGIPGALGSLIVTKTAGVGFTINAISPADGTSAVATDVSIVDWILVEHL
jgi:hypothetical protein